MPIPEITVEDLAEKLKSQDRFILLDVREPAEQEQARIIDARLEVLPMSRRRMCELREARKAPVLSVLKN